MLCVWAILLCDSLSALPPVIFLFFVWINDIGVFPKINDQHAYSPILNSSIVWMGWKKAEAKAENTPKTLRGKTVNLFPPGAQSCDSWNNQPSETGSASCKHTDVEKYVAWALTGRVEWFKSWL